MEKLYLSAEAFQRDCVRLARQIFDDAWQPQLILGLWRGGAQPGVIMSEVFAYLGRPTPHAVVKCSSYSGIGQREDRVAFEHTQSFFASLPQGLRVLAVDDVFDSGKTAEALKAQLTHVDLRIATVYRKPKASLVPFLPDYVLHETEQWIVFPHEMVGLTPVELRAKDPVLADLLLARS